HPWLNWIRLRLSSLLVRGGPNDFHCHLPRAARTSAHLPRQLSFELKALSISAHKRTSAPISGSKIFAERFADLEKREAKARRTTIDGQDRVHNRHRAPNHARRNPQPHSRWHGVEPAIPASNQTRHDRSEFLRA